MVSLQVAQRNDGTCTVPQANPTTCNQFGADCRMWEGPDFFNVSLPGSTAPSGVLAFKWSDQVCIDQTLTFTQFALAVPSALHRHFSRAVYCPDVL